MSHLRKDPLTRRWVVVATKRRDRPRRTNECPFCPGNEGMTPSEIMRAGTNSSWQVRVIPNLFPILGDGKRPASRGFYKFRSGDGCHEIIIETPQHNQHIVDLKIENLVLIIDTYQQRLLAHKKNPKIRHSLIFKNFGRRAGASLKHSHSQIISMPIIPKRVAEEIATARRFYRNHNQCIYCRIIEEEVESKKRIISENDHFVAFVPFAARIPYEVWIIPKKHHARFSDLTRNETISIARILKSSLTKLNQVLDTPSFNYFIRTAPIREQVDDYYHYHLVIMPVTTILGGFELGTGFYVNQSLAEEDARKLREAG